MGGGLVLGALIAGAWALAGPASSVAAPGKSMPPVTAGSRYLALGDSVTFGYMESGVVPTPNYKDASAFIGYPEELGAELHLKVTNPACPGETSSSLINPKAVSNGCENTVGKPGGYRTAFPLHVHYKGSQLAYAVHYLKGHHDVRLVSLMIGANDGFVCIETTTDACKSPSEMSALRKKIAHNVHLILKAIRDKAHYTGQLAIVNYYAPVAADISLSKTLNKTVDSAAKPFGVVVANGFAEFQRASKYFDGKPCEAGLLTQLGKPGDCGIHPSYSGQALLAQALEKVIKP